jgi:hypothetical protein
MVKKLQKKTRR